MMFIEIFVGFLVLVAITTIIGDSDDCGCCGECTITCEIDLTRLTAPLDEEIIVNIRGCNDCFPAVGDDEPTVLVLSFNSTNGRTSIIGSETIFNCDSEIKNRDLAGSSAGVDTVTIRLTWPDGSFCEESFDITWTP